MIVVAFMRVWLSPSWCSKWLCRLSTTFWFSLSLCGIYLCLDNSNKQSIYDRIQEIKSITVNMLQNLSHRYSSYNRNIKCVGSTIKCMGFELIHYTINLDVVSSFMVFRDFDSMFLPTYC